jgi:hypothetical protein
MIRDDRGPQRSAPAESYVRPTRIIAAVAVLVLAGAIVSDQLAARF